ncbi:pseudaminic acid synthase [Ectothiorhodospira marina]|uniref:N-acetylneuraminate synthase n=1 Tax=Ectothiorhodospira marina TaxID=1396821 RepID=A0A1H7M574_9GAMM|nr:pseudaminic acid synthase [Ectothiorhodospira marina]SEL05727.1 N-acetylneuraminate synthase [Ectothiorhodospira marina]
MKHQSANARVTIGGRSIGTGEPPYVVAEMSGNHNHDLERALRIIDAAKAAGADAVKLQTYRADTITIDHHGDEFIVKGGLWNGRCLYELYEEAHTPWEWHAPIFEHARRIGITVFSSPFDHTAVDFLEELGAPAYKIASPELIDLPLIRKVAHTGKPIVMSTGAATLEEIGDAIQAARDAGATELVVLHCTAAYPAPPEETNLVTIKALAERFDVVVGLSDHTLGTTVSALAVGMGASFIEKHVTLARADGGVDSAFSLEPQELAELVTTARIAQAAVGRPTFGPTTSEASVLRNRRSLYVVKPIAKGEVLTLDNIRSIRPANGLKPKHLDAVLGQRAARDLSFGEPLNFEMITGYSEEGSALR